MVGRGIDVTGISHIINYDLPDDPENYVHRIGRTGRMGADGIAIAFVTPEQGEQLTDIEMSINKLIEEERMPNFEAYAAAGEEVRSAEAAVEAGLRPAGRRSGTANAVRWIRNCRK